jgi:hypothetical protein
VFGGAPDNSYHRRAGRVRHVTGGGTPDVFVADPPRPAGPVSSHTDTHSRVANRPCTRPVFRKPAFLKKLWPRKIAGLVTGLEWLGGFECVKKV